MSFESHDAGVGLFIHEACKGAMDPYFESADSPVPIHGNIYIEGDSEGMAKIKGKIVDEVDSLFLIFDDTNGNLYPFDEVIVSIDHLKVWSITSTGAKMLELATIGENRSEGLSQTVVRLPLWLAKDYRKQIPVPNRLVKGNEIPFFLFGMDMTVQVVGSLNSFTLGAHVVQLPKKSRAALMLTSRECAIDRWDENHHVFGAPSVESLGVDIILPNEEPTTIVKFANNSGMITTDILFAAFGDDGDSIPIKYLRAYNGRNLILSVNTSQLQLDSPNSTRSGYLYSHLPGKLNLERLDLIWEVEFFTPQSYASIYVYPRIWNFLRCVKTDSPTGVGLIRAVGFAFT